MIYRSQNPLDRERATRRLKELFDKECVFDITERKQRRTSQQNRYLHLILTYLAMETGYTVEWVKRELFKKVCNRDMFLIKKNGKFGIMDDVRSSADLDTTELSTAIERFRNWSSQEAGIYLPSANEYKFLDEIEIEAQRYKEYL
jgi:hypothetical protein